MSFSDRFKQVVATVAPLIGTAFGGPLGGLAGNFVASKLGVPLGDQKALEAKVLDGDPQVMLKLKEANDAFQAHLADLGVQEDQLIAADTANARAREIAVRDNTPKILAYLVTAGFFSVLWYMLKNGTPQTGGEAFLVMLGALGTAWAGIMTYYYGSSAGSAAAHQAVNNLASKK